METHPYSTATSPATMYKPPHKRAISPSLPAARSVNAMHPESGAPGGQAQSSTGIAFMIVQTETVGKYEPPHKRGTFYDTAGQRSHVSSSYSARPKAVSRPTAAPRFFSVGTNFSQYTGPYAVGSAAATPPCNELKAASVPASSAVLSSKVTAARSGSNTFADISSLHSYTVGAAPCSGTPGQPDLQTTVNASPSLVELLTSPDTGTGLDTADATASGPSAAATWANEQLKAKGSASGQHKVDAAAPQKAIDNGQEAGPRAHMQPKAEVDAAPEGHLELGGSIAQRYMATATLQAGVHGQLRAGRVAAINMKSHAENGPSVTASQSKGMLFSDLSTVVCITESIHAFKGHATASTVTVGYTDYTCLQVLCLQVQILLLQVTTCDPRTS